MIRRVLAVLLAAIVVVLVASTAEAVPGSLCIHTSECSRGEYCVSDGWGSSTGHCTVLHILP
jgi:hypothetical protein